VSALEVRDLRVVYRRSGEPDRVALDGFSLQSDNELLALLGPNGAGKSTLMGVISQTIQPNSGERIAPVSRTGLSIVFQTPALDDLLTVRENLRVSGALHGVSKTDTEARIDSLAEELNISDRLDEQVRHLSGGLARRADLARALIPHPSLLLLDEPTSGLDIDARRSFWDSMDRIREKIGMSVLLSTHLIDEAERADRVAMISHGRCIAIDTPKTLCLSLGERVLRVRASHQDHIDAAEHWIESLGHVAHRIGQTILVPDAQSIDVQTCPIEGLALTIASPTLEDAYSIRTNEGALV
jgi:ABC-2 type transport system ATP-binding protein